MHRKFRFFWIPLTVLFLTMGYSSVGRSAFAIGQRPTDDQLRAGFVRDKKTFELLKEMLQSDRSLSCIGVASVNEFPVKNSNLEELLGKAGIDEKRYEEYLSLLKSIGCTNLAYTTSVGGSGSAYSNKNEIWFLVWNPTNRHSKNIVFTVDGNPPHYSLVVPDTDAALEEDVDRTRFAAVSLGSHWYILQAKWAGPAVSRDLSNLEALLNIVANFVEIAFVGIGVPTFGTSLALLYLPDRRKLGFILLPVAMILFVIGVAIPGVISVCVAWCRDAMLGVLLL